MKKISGLTAVVLTILMAFLFAPVGQAAVGSVEVTAVANPTTLFDGEMTTIEITITNNTGADIYMNGYHIQHCYLMIGETLGAGATRTFTERQTIDFSTGDPQRFSVELLYDGGSWANSNELVIYEDQWVVVEPARTTLDFSVAPDRTAVESGGVVTYTIEARNTGNCDYTDFTVLYRDPFGVVDAVFYDLAQGQSRTDTYQVSYTANYSVAFDYTFGYSHDGVSNQITMNDAASFWIFVVHPDMDVNAVTAVDQIAAGSAADVTLTMQNTGDIPLYDLKIYDGQNKLLGSLPVLAQQGSKTANIKFTPPQPGSYDFAVKARDDYGNWYTYRSNKVDVFFATEDSADEPGATVAAAQAEPAADGMVNPSEAEAAQAAAEAEAAQAAAEAEAAQAGEATDKELELGAQQGGLSGLAIGLIVAAAVLLAGGIPLIVFLTRRKGKTPGGGQ